jgi:DNA-binding PadR family transcriptional regulator
MNINDPSVRTVLGLMEKSTGHRYYAAELCEITEYSKPTIYRTLATIKSAGFATAQEEDLDFCAKRAPRIGYEPTQCFLNFYRMTPLSSLR